MIRKCDKCNIALDENNDCPNCGIHYVFIDEKIKAFDGFKLEKKNKELYKSKKHPYYETQFQRIEKNHDRNADVIRYKKEDRLNDEYEETIKTFQNEIIHNCKEKLSNHRGHGNAKNKAGKEK